MDKNKGKKSWLLRFKPCDVALPAIMPKRNSGDPVLSYLAVADKHGAVLPAMLISMIGGGAVNCRGDCRCVARREKKGRDRWHTLRTAMHGTTLMKKVISRRKANKENLSSLSKSNTNLEEINSFPAISSPINSPSSVVSSAIKFPDLTDQVSTNDTYSMSQTPRNNGTCAITTNKQCEKGLNGSTIALYCMILISLLVLVLWGRLPAIMCTSVLLYIVHPKRRKPCNERGLVGEGEVDNLVQNKNKVVEKKLESTHGRVSFASKNVSMSKP